MMIRHTIYARIMITTPPAVPKADVIEMQSAPPINPPPVL